MKITIAYLTGRAEPHVEWLIDALERQARPGDQITLVIVDHAMTHQRCRCAICEARTTASIGYRQVECITGLVHTPPKPTPWSGTHRITSRDWWSKSSSANTAIVMAPLDTEYIVFIDDRCRPGPNYLATVRQGFAERRSVLAGSYQRLETRGDGTIVVPDHRASVCPGGTLGHTNGRWASGCGGNWCYGCSIALPFEWVLQVNGFEEGCDSLTGEDYIFGLMLANAGHRIDFAPELFVSLDRTTHNSGVRNGGGAFTSASGKGGFAATDKGVSPNDKSHAALARFGRRSRTEFTPDLRELRARWHTLNLGAAAWPMPDPEMRDWFDGQRVVEMRPPS